LADLSDELKDKSPTECLNAFGGAISEKLRESEAAHAAMENHGITSGAENEAMAAAISGLETALTQCREAEIQFSGIEEKLTSAEEEVREAERQIDAMAEPTVYLFTRDENVGYSCFSSDSRIVDGIAKVFPIFFFLVAALVCTTTMTRMVDEERVQIGTL